MFPDNGLSVSAHFCSSFFFFFLLVVNRTCNLLIVFVLFFLNGLFLFIVEKGCLKILADLNFAIVYSSLLMDVLIKNYCCIRYHIMDKFVCTRLFM